MVWVLVTISWYIFSFVMCLHWLWGLTTDVCLDYSCFWYCMHFVCPAKILSVISSRMPNMAQNNVSCFGIGTESSYQMSMLCALGSWYRNFVFLTKTMSFISMWLNFQEESPQSSELGTCPAWPNSLFCAFMVLTWDLRSDVGLDYSYLGHRNFIPDQNHAMYISQHDFFKFKRYHPR